MAICFFSFFLTRGANTRPSRGREDKLPWHGTAKRKSIGEPSPQISPTIQQLGGSAGSLPLVAPTCSQTVTNNHSPLLGRQLLRPPARENSGSGSGCEAEGRGGGGGLTESTHGSAGTTLIWPRRNNGTNCSDSAAQWPLLVRQARLVTGEAGAAQWFEHPATGEQAPHAAQIWRTAAIPRENTGEPVESPSKREAVDHCDVFQRTFSIINTGEKESFMQQPF